MAPGELPQFDVTADAFQMSARSASPRRRNHSGSALKVSMS